MKGDSHYLVANLSLACLGEKERHILYPRWGGIESGATLSDHFRIMWEIEDIKNDKKQLVHRCYIDSKDPKDHGCVTRVMDYAEGSIGFINDYMRDKEGYTEEEFLENLGMFLGVVSHHIADLCTPVHVGHLIDHKSLGFPTLARFHNQVERDILKFERQCKLSLPKLFRVEITRDYFWNIAADTYKNLFLNLPAIYSGKNDYSKLQMTSDILYNAVKHTTLVWHTILKETKMTSRKWSMQPLL
ncbi:MAG: hypothetical protein IH852_14545 [Bacteroidetes bacterium]|nr:hypothetical protein [Bacteroidota bacterium]